MYLHSIIWDIDPILLHIGEGGIRWYGLLWALGIMICYLIQIKLYKNENCPKEWTDHLFVWMVTGAIIGARLGHCLFYEWHYYQDAIQLFAFNIHYRNPYIEHPFWLLRIWEGGLSSHGGAIGLIVAAWLLNKKHFSKRPEYHTSLIWIFDRLVIGVCITGALIRLGNLMNSEIYGCETTLPWGFKFLRDFPKLSADAVPVCHPTQIYEALAYFIMFLVLQFLYWKKDFGKKYTGMLFGIGFIWVFVFRFIVEFIKNDQSDFEADMILNMGQLLSIPFIIYGIYLIINAIKKKQ